MYSDLANSLTGHKSRQMTNAVLIEELRRNRKEFKPLAIATLDENCQTGLCMLMTQLVGYLIDDLQRFECLQILDASPFKSSNLHKKRAFMAISQVLSSSLVETADDIDTRGQEDLRRTPSMCN